MTQATPSDPSSQIPTKEIDEKQRNKIIEFLNSVRQRFEKKPGHFENFIEILREHTHHSLEMTINNIVSLFGENYDLIETFNTFLPNKWQITSTNSNFDSQTPAQTTIFSNQTLASTSGSNTTTTSTNLQKTSPSTTSLQNKIPNHDACKQCAQQLLEMIQSQYPSENYHEFMRLVQAHRAKEISLSELTSKVHTLFHDNINIISKFDELLKLLQDESSMTSSISTPQTTTSQPTSLSSSSSSMLQASESHDNKTKITHHSKKKSKEKEKMGTRNSENDASNKSNTTTTPTNILIPPEKSNTNTNTNTASSIPQASAYTRAHKRKEKRVIVFEDFDISQIDLDKCERNGHSYVVLPVEARRARCSGREGDSLCQSVLNDVYMSIPNTQDGYFRESPKTPYEEVLFRLEDDQFEIDRLIESSQSTVNLLEQILKALKAHRIPFDEIDIEAALNRDSAVHMRCIKDLYRYRENEITIALRHDPEKAVSQIIAKLKQKIAEWRVAKEKIWNKIWNVSYRRNYIHALDHRRFYWRTQEKKQIHPKVLLAEIRRLYYMKIMEGRHPIEHMKFTIPSANILKDTEKLILLTGRKLLSHDEFEKLKNLVNLFQHLFNFRDQNGEAEQNKPFSEGKNQDVTMYGDSTFFVIIRLFEILLSRLLKAKELSSFDSSCWDWTKYLRPEPPSKIVDEPPMFDLEYLPSSFSDKDKSDENEKENEEYDEEMDKIKESEDSRLDSQLKTGYQPETETVIKPRDIECISNNEVENEKRHKDSNILNIEEEENDKSQERDSEEENTHKDVEEKDNDKERNQLADLNQMDEDTLSTQRATNFDSKLTTFTFSSMAIGCDQKQVEYSTKNYLFHTNIEHITNDENHNQCLNHDNHLLKEVPITNATIETKSSNITNIQHKEEEEEEEENKITVLPTETIPDLPPPLIITSQPKGETEKSQNSSQLEIHPGTNLQQDSNLENDAQTKKPKRKSRMTVRVSNRIRNRLKKLWESDCKETEKENDFISMKTSNNNVPENTTTSNTALSSIEAIDSYWKAAQSSDPFVLLSKEEKYSALLNGIEQLLEGQIEQHEMEERCLKMFGKESFPLYTIHMVLLQIVRQMREFNESPKTPRLLSAFYEELKRQQTTDQMDIEENSDTCPKKEHYTNTEYFQVVKEILPHEQIFKITFNKKHRTLSVLLTDPHYNNGYFDIKGTIDKIRWIRYVQNFIGTNTSPLEKMKHSVFLKRNLKKVQSSNELLTNVEKHNALECVIEPDTFGIRYVRDSEDYFHRRHSRPLRKRKSQEILDISEQKKKKGLRLDQLINQRLTTQQPKDM